MQYEVWQKEIGQRVDSIDTLKLFSNNLGSLSTGVFGIIKVNPSVKISLQELYGRPLGDF